MSQSTVTVFNKKKPIFELLIYDDWKIEPGTILNKDLMPICLQTEYSEESIEKWMKARTIPDERIGRKAVLQMFGETDLRHSMFSLSDQYWFRWNDSETWERGNFFTNTYPTDYGRMYFSPWTVKRKNLEKESPDRTTNGVLKKRWVQPDENDRRSYLIKSGNRKAHQEPISEVLSSMTLAMLKIISYVEYELIIDGFELCSRCRNFINRNTEFVPASQIYHAVPSEGDESVFDHMVRSAKAFGVDGAKDYLYRMIAADFLICNNDRHLSNFGFIRSAETGKLKGFAPIFDSGSAFFGNANKNGSSSRLFPGMEEKALKYTVQKCGLSGEYSCSDLLEVVDMYPLISASEKGRISETIQSVYKRLNETIKDCSDA